MEPQKRAGLALAGALDPRESDPGEIIRPREPRNQRPEASDHAAVAPFPQFDQSPGRHGAAIAVAQEHLARFQERPHVAQKALQGGVIPGHLLMPGFTGLTIEVNGTAEYTGEVQAVDHRLPGQGPPGMQPEDPADARVTPSGPLKDPLHLREAAARRPRNGRQGSAAIGKDRPILKEERRNPGLRTHHPYV